jgi:amidohydrolase
LQQLKSEFAGTIKLLFQPAEELIPGGAGKMIRDGVLQNPRPDMVIGQHVAPSIPAGKVGIRKGRFMASMDEIRVKVRGKGGHAAQPNLNVDPVLITSHIIVTLQQIVSRMANPSLPTVLSFGKVIANGGINIIPDEVYIEGTFRTMNETWRNDAHTRMIKIAESLAESMGGQCEFNISKGYPFLENNDVVAVHVEAAALQYLGEDSIVDPGIWMAAEDFAYYTQEVNSCFYLLGTGNEEKNITSALHTSTFNIDEQALLQGPGLMAYIALSYLGS